MPRRKENGRSTPRADRERFSGPAADLYRKGLARDVLAGSRELRRRFTQAERAAEAA